MDKLISDISKRTLIVKGREEADRILNLTKVGEFHSVEAKEIGGDFWPVELVYKVGSYYRK